MSHLYFSLYASVYTKKIQVTESTNVQVQKLYKQNGMCSLGLQDISCISDCMGLLHLDLAKNNISDLKDLGRLRTLHVQCM